MTVSESGLKDAGQAESTHIAFKHKSKIAGNKILTSKTANDLFWIFIIHNQLISRRHETFLPSLKKIHPNLYLVNQAS